MTSFGNGTAISSQSLNTAFANVFNNTYDFSKINCTGDITATGYITSASYITATGNITSSANIGWSATTYLTPVTGATNQFGSVKVFGTPTASGWEGYSIAGNAVFMSNATSLGLYDQTNFEWSLLYTRNGSTAITFNGVTKVETSNTGATTTGTHTATTFSGSGASLTALPAGQLTGTIANARISGTYTGFTGLTSSGTVEASLGALGTTATNSLIHFKLSSTTNNGDFLLLTANRLATGTDWTTAAYTIQRLVDATYMGFIRFGDGASGQNVQIGVNATKYLSVSSTATNVTGLLTVDNIWNTSTATTTLTGFQYVVRSTGGLGNYAHFTSMREGKRNIVTIADSGTLIDQLNPVTYQAKIDETDDEISAGWKDRDLEYGFIAEEVAEVGTGFLAQYMDDGEGNLKPAGWKWQGVVSVLVAEVQSVRKRLEELEKA
jgi:hypothetical protein